MNTLNTYDDDHGDSEEKDLSSTTRTLEDYLPHPQPYRVSLFKEGNNNDESAILSVVYFILVVTVFVALLALIIMVIIKYNFFLFKKILSSINLLVELYCRV